MVSTLIATHATGRNAKALGRDLSTEIEKLLQLPRVLSDARHQLHPDPSESALDFKRAREERIKAVVMVVLHAESFAATNNLNPILPKQKTRGSYLNLNLSKRKSLGAQSYPVKALLRSGIFEDMTTVEEFKNLENPFSDKELCVVAGFLEESVDGVAFIEEGGKKEEAAERKAKEEADRAAEERRKKEEAVVREANAKQKKKEERQEAKEKTEREEKAKADERKRVAKEEEEKFNNKTLLAAVKEWLNDKSSAEKKYGDLSKWDTSKVTDMSSMFFGASAFNGDLS